MSRAWALLAVWAAFAGPAHGQITGMATTDDGSVVYFATPFNLAGTANPTAAAKIFVYDANGFRLFADQFPTNAPVNITISNPWVSGDGSVAAYRGTYSTENVCGLLQICYNTYTETAVQIGSAPPIVLNGAAVLSASGQYALLPGPTLLDLTTGAQTGIPQPPPYDKVLLDGVASDGTVLLYNLGLGLLDMWRPGWIRYIAAAPPAAVMDDAADTVVYVQDIALYLYDVATDTSRLFANGSAPSISRDGKWVAFLSPVDGVLQAWAVPADGSEFLQLTREPLGVTSVIISGNGQVVYAATARNDIWEYDLAAGTSTQIVPPTLAPTYYGGVAGSLATIAVTGLVTDPAAAAYRVLLNGSPAPIVSLSPAGLTYQIPWETPLRSFATVELQSPAPNPVFLAAPGSIFIESFAPVFLTTPCDSFSGQCITATHADGSAVSTGSPAHPGESVNLFLTGLGAVSPAVATGAPGPENPPAVVQHSFACQLVQQDGVSPPLVLGDLQKLTAILTPGAVGTYRVTAQLPAAVGDSPYALVYCQGSDYYAPGVLPVAPAPVP